MKIGLGLWACAAAALPLGSLALAADEPAPMCTDASRSCLLLTVMTYIDGLARHDSSKIPFTADVRATEQRDVVVTERSKFRSEIDNSTAIIGARNIRLIADPETSSVAAFYLLDVAGEKGKPDYSVWRGQRFKIIKGRVAEVEVYNFIEPNPKGLGPQLWPGGTTLPRKP